MKGGDVVTEEEIEEDLQGRVPGMSRHSPHTWIMRSPQLGLEPEDQGRKLSSKNDQVRSLIDKMMGFKKKAQGVTEQEAGVIFDKVIQVMAEGSS